MRRFLPLMLSAALLLSSCNQASTTEKASTEGQKQEDPRLQAGALRIGDQLPDFTLKTLDGQSIQLSSLFNGENIVAVIWHSPACPCAYNCLTAVREKLSSEQYKNLKIIGVASDSQQDTEWFKTDLKAQIDEKIVTFPVVFDPDQAVMKLYGAKRTPTVFLADQTGKLQFWGAPENSLYPGTEGHRALIHEAVDALIAKKTPDPQTFPPIGCLIE